MKEELHENQRASYISSTFSLMSSAISILSVLMSYIPQCDLSQTPFTFSGSSTTFRICRPFVSDCTWPHISPTFSTAIFAFAGNRSFWANMFFISLTCSIRDAPLKYSSQFTDKYVSCGSVLNKKAAAEILPLTGEILLGLHNRAMCSEPPSSSPFIVHPMRHTIWLNRLHKRTR